MTIVCMQAKHVSISNIATLCNRKHWKEHKNVCGKSGEWKWQNITPTARTDVSIHQEVQEIPLKPFIVSEILTGYSKPILVQIPIWELYTWVSDFCRQAGHVVTLVGLSKSELNDQVGEIVDFDAVRGRFVVLLSGREVPVKVQPKNVKPNAAAAALQGHEKTLRSAVSCIKLWAKRERTGNAQFTRQDIANLGHDVGIAYVYGVDGVAMATKHLLDTMWTSFMFKVLHVSPRPQVCQTSTPFSFSMQEWERQLQDQEFPIIFGDPESRATGLQTFEELRRALSSS